MAKNSWSRQPPVLRLFMYIEQARLKLKQETLNEQLTRARALLDKQVSAVKNSHNGK